MAWEGLKRTFGGGGAAEAQVLIQHGQGGPRASTGLEGLPRGTRTPAGLVRVALFLPLLVFPFVPTTSFAGSWGFELGANYAVFDHDAEVPDTEVDWLVFPSACLLVEYAVSNRASLIPALRYTEQGERTTIQTAFDWSRQKVLERTLGAGLGLRHSVASWLFISVEPEFSYLLSGTATGSANVPSPLRIVSYEDDYTERVQRWEMLVRAGLGVVCAAGESRVTLAVRYRRALTSRERTTGYIRQTQRNIAWTAPEPFFTAESVTQGVEVAAGVLW